MQRVADKSQDCVRPKTVERVRPKVSAKKPSRALTGSELAILDGYASHTLADLPAEASLMNRVGKKFVIPRALLSDLLQHLRSGYSALELNKQRLFRYHNTYYDSVGYDLYLDHHNGKSNRYKIRHRTYVDSDTSFLEVKFKNNKKRTLKTRTLLGSDEKSLEVVKAAFLSENGLLNHAQYHPTQTGTYVRIALANTERSERITIDVDLAFAGIENSGSYVLGPWVVVEVKQSRQNRDSGFFAWAQQNGIRRSKFSKYCMGVYFTGPLTLKRNNFHRIAKHMQIRPVLSCSLSQHSALSG